MSASDFWARCAATVFVIAVAVAIVIAIFTNATPPPLFFYISGALLGACIVCALIAYIWE